MSHAKFLTQVAVFREMESDQIEKVAALMQETEYDEGEIIFNEKASGQHLFVVLSGVVEIFREIEGEERHVRLARLEPGEVFGELSLADGQPRSAGARATIDPKTRVLVLSRANLERLLDENPVLAVRFYRGLARKLGERLRKVDDAVADLSRALSYSWY